MATSLSSVENNSRLWFCFVLVYCISTASATASVAALYLPIGAIYRGTRSVVVGEQVVLGSDTSSLSSSINKKDICEFCECTGGNNTLTTIKCDLSEHKNQLTNFKINRRASSLHILLGQKTYLSIEPGFFENTAINGVVIEGSLRDEQVEIGTGAFTRTMGPFPEIQIIKCQSVIIRPRSFKGDFKLLIKQSKDVIIWRNAFADASLFANFTEIDDLRIQEQTFHNSKAEINISYSNLENIYPFETSLSVITFSHCVIGTIHSGAFNVNSIPLIRFDACKINVIKSKAITEKLQSDGLAITETDIETIESEAISGGIEELVLSGNRINKIHENAIDVIAINATIINNSIKHMDQEWFRVQQWSNAIVKNNIFGVYSQMVFENPPPAGTPSTCIFDGNFITKPKPGSLNMPYPQCRFHKVSIKKHCTCNTSWLEQLSDHDLRSESYCMLEGTLAKCYNTTMINYLKYINDVCDENKTVIKCWEDKSVHKIDGQFYTDEELQERDDVAIFEQPFFYIPMAILILILLIVIACYCYIVKQRNAVAPKGHIHGFSVADGQILNQSLETMKSRHPKKYKKFYKLLQNFRQPDNRLEKCNNLIIKITDLLDTCDGSKEDFADLNEILRKHIDPMPSAPIAPISEPIYADPTAPNMHSDNAHRSQLEPNYTELEEETLLRAQYAVPRDEYSDTGNLYSDPIYERNIRVPQPYATAIIPNRAHQTSTPIQIPPTPPQRPQKPSVCQAPRITPSSQPQTKVQRIVQLENGQHPVQYIPVYTEIDQSRKGVRKPITLSSFPSGSTAYARNPTNVVTSTSDSGSNHSGGSDVTMKIDDVIEYADA